MTDVMKAEALTDLARRIVKHTNDADGHVISAAMLLREAHRRVEAGDAGDIKWYEWAKKNIKLSQSRLRDLLRIAEADDPANELERQRKLMRKRAEKHRGGKAEAWRQDEERKNLIAWTKEAPIEEVKRALRQVRGLAGIAPLASTANHPTAGHKQAA